MDIDIMQIVLIVIFSGLAWWVNDMLNKIAILKTVIQVVIVVVAVILLLQALGLGGSLHTHISVH